MASDFMNLLVYIVLPFKPYTSLNIENKLRQINLIVFQTGNMTTKRKNPRFFKVSFKYNALTLLLNEIYSKEKKGF